MYTDLHELLMCNDRERQYFLKLPVHVQLTIHQKNDEIKTAMALHRYADLITKTSPDRY